MKMQPGLLKQKTPEFQDGQNKGEIMGDLISSDLDEGMKDNWGTDPLIFNALDNEFNFLVDAACSEENGMCFIKLTKERNALNIDWASLLESFTQRTVWINPPYGRGMIKQYMSKCIEQKEKGVTSVLLVPATLDAQWLPIESVSEIRIITGGRLSFYHPITNKKIAGNTKGSMIVIFRPSKMPCVVKLIDRDELLNAGV